MAEDSTLTDIGFYLDRITSEHNQKPIYLTTVSATIQPLLDTMVVTSKLTIDFDIDIAIGAQLDAVGVRVGRNRFVTVPFNIYFSFGVEGLGFGEGVWKKRTDPTTGLTELPDDLYRLVLKAKVKANQWDGSLLGVYDAWNTMFTGQTCFVLAQDYGNESLAYVLVGPSPSALNLALFQNSGLDIDLKPATYTLYMMLPTVYPAAIAGGTPLFGFGVDNDVIGGFGRGAWTKII